MAPTTFFLLVLLLATPFAYAGLEEEEEEDPTSLYDADAFNHTSVCHDQDGHVGDCTDDGEEAAMESEPTRRLLAATRWRFISYGALRRNRVPCSRRGRSYYNCHRRGRANPYRRSCTAITRCARDLS